MADTKERDIASLTRLIETKVGTDSADILTNQTLGIASEAPPYRLFRGDEPDCGKDPALDVYNPLLKRLEDVVSEFLENVYAYHDGASSREFDEKHVQLLREQCNEKIQELLKEIPVFTINHQFDNDDDVPAFINIISSVYIQTVVTKSGGGGSLSVAKNFFRSILGALLHYGVLDLAPTDKNSREKISSAMYKISKELFEVAKDHAKLSLSSENTASASAPASASSQKESNSSRTPRKRRKTGSSTA